jgi:hypothetical protein
MNPFMANITAAITAMLVTYVPIFLAFGVGMFRALSVVLLCVEGYRWAFNRADPYRLASTLFTIALVYCATTFYAVPLPGFGISVSHIIPDQGQYWLSKLEVASVDAVNAHIDDMWNRFDTPGLVALLENLLYWFGLVFIIFPGKMIGLIIIAFALIGSAICTAVGPWFLVFGLFESTRWLMWSWIKVALTFAYIPVIAVLWIMFFERVLFNVLNGMPALIPPAQYMVYLAQVGAVLLAMMYGLLKVPQFTQGLINGAANVSNWTPFNH